MKPALWGRRISFIFFIAVSWVAWAAESPITRIKADYLCHFISDAVGDRGDSSGTERVGFSFPSREAMARAWLGIEGEDLGLEVQIESFSFKSCVGCFEAEGFYRFSGASNRVHLQTVEWINGENNWPAGVWPPPPPVGPDEPDIEPIVVPTPPDEGDPLSHGLSFFERLARSAVVSQSQDCDVPPGMEPPPGCDGAPPPACDPNDPNLPPGSCDPGTDPDDPDTPVDPVVPAGPPLRVRYYETNSDGSRVIFKAEGLCEALPSVKNQRAVAKQHRPKSAPL